MRPNKAVKINKINEFNKVFCRTSKQDFGAVLTNLAKTDKIIDERKKTSRIKFEIARQ